MGKKLSIGVSGIARKGKRGWIGVDNKARKIKKMWIGDSNGKARLCWSGSGRFLNQVWTKAVTSSSSQYVKNSFVSDDGLTWKLTSTERPFNFKDIIYAKGKFWAIYPNSNQVYIYSSPDGETWTLVKLFGEDNSCYFDGRSAIIRYENGVFIIHDNYQNNSKYMCYSTDGVTWTGMRYNHQYSSYQMYRPIDIRYGTVNGVSGWYILASDESNITVVYRFKTLNDLTSGNAEVLTAIFLRSNRGLLDIRNDTLYVLFSYYTGVIENANHTIYLYSYKTSQTQIGKVTGNTLGSMWITDKTLAFRGIWWNDAQMAFSAHFAKYTYSTGEFVSGTSDWYGGSKIETKNTAFVDGRMWQVTGNIGRYSDDYGTTVTRFTIPTGTNGTVDINYRMLVYGDENYGYYRA